MLLLKQDLRLIVAIQFHDSILFWHVSRDAEPVEATCRVRVFEVNPPSVPRNFYFIMQRPHSVLLPEEAQLIVDLKHDLRIVD